MRLARRCLQRLGSASVEQAFAGARPGTSRPVTSSGRFVRLGTASMLSEPGGPFVNVDHLDLRKCVVALPLRVDEFPS